MRLTIGLTWIAVIDFFGGVFIFISGRVIAIEVIFEVISSVRYFLIIIYQY
jgi:hypothetical protein